MTSIEDANYVLRGFRGIITEKDQDHFEIEKNSRSYLIKKEDVDLYLSKKELISSKFETQIYIPGHYEQVVQFEGPRYRRPYSRDESALKLESKDGIKVEIGRPSILFFIRMFDTDSISRDIYRIISYMPSINSPNFINDTLRLNTIKISYDEHMNISERKLRDILEACVFHFAYGSSISLSLTKSFSRSYYHIGRDLKESVQFPLKHYNFELVGYYNLALASESMVLSFLALYNILEYFYSSVSEEGLHLKLREKLTAPEFSHTKTKKLRELIEEVRKYERQSNELSTLQLVIARYFQKDELRVWIKEYEEKNGPYFTIDVSLFGGNFRIDVSDNAIIKNISSRIYHIRNALVHNKEDSVSRYLPYSGHDEVIRGEIDIILYISEQIIIRTGKDI